MQFLNTRVPSGRVLGVRIANPQGNAVFTHSWALDSSFRNSNLYKQNSLPPGIPLGTPLGVFSPFPHAKFFLVLPNASYSR